MGAAAATGYFTSGGYFKGVRTLLYAYEMPFRSVPLGAQGAI